MDIALEIMFISFLQAEIWVLQVLEAAMLLDFPLLVEFYKLCSYHAGLMSRSRRLGLETVSRPVFEMSRSRLVNFVGTSRLEFKVKCLGLGHEGLVYCEHELCQIV